MPNNTLLDLGELYVSDFLDDTNGSYNDRTKESLKLILDESIGAPRLTKAVDPDKMYGKYWYRSGINDTMKQKLEDVAVSCLNSIDTKEGDVFLGNR